MPKKRGNKKRLRRKSVNPSESANRYTGPLVLPMKAQQAELYSVMLYQEMAVTTNGSGVTAPVIACNLSAFDESSSFQNVYDEWRMLSAVCHYCPFSDVPTSTLTAGGLITLVPDRDTATNLTGLPQALAQGGSPHNPFVKGPRVVYRMESSEESAFQGSNTAVPMWFKLYGSGLAVTQTYGTLIVAAIWQFRGRI